IRLAETGSAVAPVEVEDDAGGPDHQDGAVGRDRLEEHLVPQADGASGGVDQQRADEARTPDGDVVPGAVDEVDARGGGGAAVGVVAGGEDLRVHVAVVPGGGGAGGPAGEEVRRGHGLGGGDPRGT